jgi:predicted nucleic acid-binding protein
VPLRPGALEQLILSAADSSAGMHLIGLDEGLLDRAGDLGAAELPSLDAIHLAAALVIGSDLGVFISCDGRLSAAAEAEGLVVAATE